MSDDKLVDNFYCYCTHYFNFKSECYNKGCFGERMVRFALSFLPQKKYIRLDDILLRENDETHQIDHIVISPIRYFCYRNKEL